MKKAKMLLTAIALLAVVGGALAFKAQKGYGAVMYTNDQANRCLVAVPNFSANTASPNPNTFASSQPTILPCPQARSIQLP